MAFRSFSGFALSEATVAVLLSLAMAAMTLCQSSAQTRITNTPQPPREGDLAPPSPPRIGGNRVRIIGRAGPAARALNRMGDAVPLPKPRPSPLAGTIDDPEPLPLDRAGKARQQPATVPRPRPRGTRATRNIAQAVRPMRDEAAASEMRPVVEPSRPDNTCLEALRQRAEVIRAEQPETDDTQCIIPDPVELRALRGKQKMAFSEGLILDCRFATRLATFMEGVGQPLARDHLGSAMEKLHSGQGFVCRRRNNALTGKLSEHSFGNAIDIVSFGFEGGTTLPVRSPSDMKKEEADFFRAFRRASCGYFTTVLGPGANAAHATHLHLDLGREDGEKKNPYRICE